MHAQYMSKKKWSSGNLCD